MKNNCSLHLFIICWSSSMFHDKNCTRYFICELFLYCFTRQKQCVRFAFISVRIRNFYKFQNLIMKVQNHFWKVREQNQCKKIFFFVHFRSSGPGSVLLIRIWIWDPDPMRFESETGTLGNFFLLVGQGLDCCQAYHLCSSLPSTASYLSTSRSQSSSSYWCFNEIIKISAFGKTAYIVRPKTLHKSLSDKE